MEEVELYNLTKVLSLSNEEFNDYINQLNQHIKEAKLECYDVDIIAKASALLSIENNINEILKATWK